MGIYGERKRTFLVVERCINFVQNKDALFFVVFPSHESHLAVIGVGLDIRCLFLLCEKVRPGFCSGTNPLISGPFNRVCNASWSKFDYPRTTMQPMRISLLT